MDVAEDKMFSLPKDDNIDPVGFLPEGSEALAKYIEEDLENESDDELKTVGELTVEDYNTKYLLKAAEKGKKDLVMEILEKDRNLIDFKDSDGYTALHRASYNGHTEVVKVLLEHGADISCKTDNNWQPLHCACRWGKDIEYSEGTLGYNLYPKGAQPFPRT